MDDAHLLEPFQDFCAYLSRYAAEEGIHNVHRIPAHHLPELKRVARELGVIFHDDGTMELIRQ